MKLGDYATQRNLEIEQVKEGLRATSQSLHPQHNVDVEALDKYFRVEADVTESGVKIVPHKPVNPVTVAQVLVPPADGKIVTMSDPNVDQGSAANEAKMLSSVPNVPQREIMLFGEKNDGKKLYTLLARGNNKCPVHGHRFVAWGYDESTAIAEVMRTLRSVDSATITWQVRRVPGDDVSQAVACL